MSVYHMAKAKCENGYRIKRAHWLSTYLAYSKARGGIVIVDKEGLYPDLYIENTPDIRADDWIILGLGTSEMDISRPQQDPKEGKESITDLVLKDIEARRQMGIQKYGTELKSHNGRDALRDAYEESLDMCLYLKQAILERDNDDMWKRHAESTK